MKVYSVRAVTYITVDTDIGDFRVWRGGKVDIWDPDLCDYTYFDDCKYNPDDVAKLKAIAHEEFTRILKDQS